ncbi:LLM class flavin-dependent oxidoreductase [Yinghuangia sp. ASG 101]|uniref:LLM class flavin-dependent oxidoreductase n=1 Tax=Yinghuangia sp. ASG 101 TaxID=2896848 RepID=UPI001E3BB4A5|nr:LLM class flavin-dependent oxidoreductase [Yinghuangia sp. ASG 101]UGQ12404.1 LLM class flavin-dependent oxidoreductase [Yinghuangia sp. ASG 101]
MSEIRRIPLSVLDTAPVWEGETATQALRATVELAEAVDRLGYRRYWLAEHHNLPNVATSSPVVVAGAIAARTRGLRVGAGGVMLPNHAPLVVAEQFGTLHALHPGRVDLGIGRAPGTDPGTARALRRSAKPLDGRDFPAQLAELIEYFQPAGRPSANAAPRIEAVPAGDNPVPVWVLGSSGSSAELAGVLGLPYAHAHHFNPDSTRSALELYRRAFSPSAALDAPYALVAAIAVVAESDERAHHLAAPLRVATMLAMRGMNPPYTPADKAAEIPLGAQDAAISRRMLGPQLIGGPDTVRARFDELVETTGLDELMALTMIHDPRDRIRSYELLAGITGATADTRPAQASAAPR